MIIINNKIAVFLLTGSYHAMCIWPFIFIRPDFDKSRLTITVNHEHIHARQQLEMAWFFFFLWYGIEYLILLLYHRNQDKAYRSISFEREALDHDENLAYLSQRRPYAWLKYL